MQCNSVMMGWGGVGEVKSERGICSGVAGQGLKNSLVRVRAGDRKSGALGLGRADGLSQSQGCTQNLYKCSVDLAKLCPI